MKKQTDIDADGPLKNLRTFISVVHADQSMRILKGDIKPGSGFISERRDKSNKETAIGAIEPELHLAIDRFGRSETKFFFTGKNKIKGRTRIQKKMGRAIADIKLQMHIQINLVDAGIIIFCR